MKLLISESEKNRILGMHNKNKFILEGEYTSNSESNANEAYELIILGSSGPGTNPDYIHQGIKQLKTKKEFDRMNTLFQDGRTGYDSFEKMIRGELESSGDNFLTGGLIGYLFGDNQEDLSKILKHLKDLGVQYTNVDWNEGDFSHFTITNEINEPNPI